MSKQKAVSKEAKIDLDRVWTPHELVTNAYKEADALFFQHESRYINEARIWTASKASNPPAKIGHNIFTLYRKRVGNREFLLFHEKLWTTDYFQNILDWSRYLGMVEIPVIVKKRGINVAAIRSDTDKVSPTDGPPEIHNLEKKYLWEFSKYKNQLEQWYKDGVISPDCHMYCWVDENKYKVTSFENFVSLPIEDLILLGKIGRRFEGVLKPGDYNSIETLRSLVKEELQKGMLGQK